LSSDLILKNALFNVDKIISISHFTKSEIIDTFPQIPESKIETIHLGVEDIFCEINDDEKNRLKIKYQLPKQFILSVCTIEPRKNLKKVLQAFALIKDKIDHQFILVGSYGWKSNDLEEYISKLNITDRVKFLGFVPKNDLPGLYGTADAFVYASLYEGFGLPPLEAMACGCPVISSNCTSIPEVVGDAGLLVDPDSVEQISDAMLKVCDSKSLQNDLKKKGIDRSKKFTWENCAKRTIDVYKSVI
jgi:glycosyltransferase involved in cell wall biosynthesis